jgi:hypothetical protein
MFIIHLPDEIYSLIHSTHSIFAFVLFYSELPPNTLEPHLKDNLCVSFIYFQT